MKQIFCLLLVTTAIISCKDKKQKPVEKDTTVSLHSDTINVVKLTDTLVIWESTCRGCAYESSTHFDIADSLGIIKMHAIKTTDDNPSDMAGGNVSKQLILVPTRTGTTTIKLYKFWKEQETAEDSARFTSYTIEVRN